MRRSHITYGTAIARHYGSAYNPSHLRAPVVRSELPRAGNAGANPAGAAAATFDPDVWSICCCARPQERASAQHLVASLPIRGTPDRRMCVYQVCLRLFEVSGWMECLTEPRQSGVRLSLIMMRR